MRRTTLLAVIGILAVAGLAVVRAQARPTAPSEDIMPALLAEVRGLRAAMEQMAAAGPRVQLALGRLQLQEQRVNNAIKRQDEVRGKLTALQLQAGAQQDRLAEAEAALRVANPTGGARTGTENGPSVEEL